MNIQDEIQNIVGLDTDTHDSDTLTGYLKRVLFYKNNRMRVSVSLADAPVLTTSVDSYIMGVAGTIVAANAIAVPFEVEHINIGAVSAKDTFQIYVYAGVEKILDARFVKDTTFDASFTLPINSKILAANTAITATIACAGGGSKTCAVSVAYKQQD